MEPSQELSKEAERLLRIILDHKLVRGGELVRLAELSSPVPLVEPLRELMKEKLVEASGLDGRLTEESLLFATFGTRPSREANLRKLAKY